MDFSALSLMLANFHQPPEDENQALESILSFGTNALNCEHAGVMLARRDRIESVAWTDKLVAQADELQYSLDEGPCHSAIHEGHTEVIPRTAESRHWPHWGREVDKLGIRSTLS